MICATCGGLVLWVGPLSNLTHTECQSCGRIDNQAPDDIDDGEEHVCGHGISFDVECEWCDQEEGSY